MILSSAELHKALDAGRLIIEPEPSPRVPTVGGEHCPYDTHSVDLTLSPEISVPKGGSFQYDLTEEGLAETLTRNSDKRTVNDGDSYKLAPGKFILGMTRESVSLPIIPGRKTCLAARIEGKSSRARCGLLIHFTAPTVHPGWHGPLTLEMINLGPSPISLIPGMPIAQLIVEEVKGLPAAPNPSQFQGQATPEGIPLVNGHPGDEGLRPTRSSRTPSRPAPKKQKTAIPGRGTALRSKRKRNSG
ncbi:MAG: dCTP deaminase [Thermoguttaceae bacterium]